MSDKETTFYPITLEKEGEFFCSGILKIEGVNVECCLSRIDLKNGDIDHLELVGSISSFETNGENSIELEEIRMLGHSTSSIYEAGHNENPTYYILIILQKRMVIKWLFGDQDDFMGASNDVKCKLDMGRTLIPEDNQS